MWESFWDLCRLRPRSQNGFHAIPATEMWAWVKMHGLEGTESVDLLFRFWTEMDLEWIAHFQEAAQQKKVNDGRDPE